MKKAALLLFIFFVVLVGSVQAEPYKGTNFPSDQQIAKSFEDKKFFKNSVGKRKDAEGVYHYFFFGEPQMQPMRMLHSLVQKLDNGVWVIEVERGLYIIQQ